MSTNNNNCAGPTGPNCATPNANGANGGTVILTGAGGGGGGAASSGSGFTAPMQISIPFPIQWISAPPIIIDGEIDLAGDLPKKDKDGCDCKVCKEFYPYAEPNQDDGTLVCYSCRMVW